MIFLFLHSLLLYFTVIDVERLDSLTKIRTHYTKNILKGLLNLCICICVISGAKVVHNLVIVHFTRYIHLLRHMTYKVCITNLIQLFPSDTDHKKCVKFQQYDKSIFEGIKKIFQFTVSATSFYLIKSFSSIGIKGKIFNFISFNIDSLLVVVIVANSR